jgi:hypothetical protein
MTCVGDSVGASAILKGDPVTTAVMVQGATDDSGRNAAAGQPTSRRLLPADDISYDFDNMAACWLNVTNSKKARARITGYRASIVPLPGGTAAASTQPAYLRPGNEKYRPGSRPFFKWRSNYGAATVST